jgi:ABC-type multidrug transport system ATPase subunit
VVSSDVDGVRSDRQIDAGQIRHEARRHVGDKKLPVAVRAHALTHVFRAKRRPFSSQRSAVRALSSFSLTVDRGQFVAVTGANGAGKTTFLEILATVLVPTSGDVSVCGFDVRASALEVRRRIAYCPAGGSSFWPRLTGAENLDFFTRLTGVPLADQSRRLREAADDVGLPREVFEREVRTFSDGQAQRLNLARALLRGADVWLVDEPTRSLDPAGQTAMWALIRDRARERGATVIAATHDLAGVAAVADLTAALT